MFWKGYTENWLRETFIIKCVLKTNPWTYNIKDLKRSFSEKELLRSIL